MNTSSSKTDPTLEYMRLLETLYTKYGIQDVKKHTTDLVNSVYSAQCNDYIMLRHNNYNIPVDAEMYSLVKYLIDVGLPLGGWNYRNSRNNCFFTIMTDKYHEEFPTIDKIIDTLSKIMGTIMLVHEGYDKGSIDNVLVNVYLNFGEQSFVTVVFNYTVIDVLKAILNLPPAYGTMLPGCKRLVECGMIDFDSLEDIRCNMYCNNVNSDEIFIVNKNVPKKRKREKLCLIILVGS